MQEALLVHFFGAVLALATAVTANVLTRLQRTERHGALEIFSLLFAVAALLLVLFTAHVHSTSHRTNSNESPNKVDRIQAAKIASQLSVGMQEEAAEKFLSRNGITNSLKLGCSHGWTSVFILSDGCILALDVAPKQAGADGAWAGGLLRAADIQSNGVKIVSIILTNAP